MFKPDHGVVSNDAIVLSYLRPGDIFGKPDKSPRRSLVSFERQDHLVAFVE